MPRFKDATINLPEKSGNVRTWDSINTGLLMDLRDELKQLNAVFDCTNFQSIPRELRAIKRELATYRKEREATRRART